MADPAPSRQSWWQTLPGILTGVAALITAVTGFIVAFNHTRSEPSSPSSKSSEAGTQTSRPAAESRDQSDRRASAKTQPVALPPLNRVKLAGGDAVITLLAAEVEPIDLERKSLSLKVRYLNAGRYQANFWSASYRLIVDDVPRAPTNFLDELVDAGAAKEGQVVFEVPNTIKDVVLQISAGDEKSRIPLTLP